MHGASVEEPVEEPIGIPAERLTRNHMVAVVSSIATHKQRRCHQIKVPNHRDQHQRNVPRKIQQTSNKPARIAKPKRAPAKVQGKILPKRTHAKTSSKKFECSHCDKVCKRKFDLKRHELTHTQDRVKCRFCSKTFSRPDNRCVHERSKHLQ